MRTRIGPCGSTCSNSNLEQDTVKLNQRVINCKATPLRVFHINPPSDKLSTQPAQSHSRINHIIPRQQQNPRTHNKGKNWMDGGRAHRCWLASVSGVAREGVKVECVHGHAARGTGGCRRRRGSPDGVECSFHRV